MTKRVQRGQRLVVTAVRMVEAVVVVEVFEVVMEIDTGKCP